MTDRDDALAPIGYFRDNHAPERVWCQQCRDPIVVACCRYCGAQHEIGTRSQWLAGELDALLQNGVRHD